MPKLRQVAVSAVIGQGMQQGIIQKAKEDVIEVLELCFGKISSEIIEKITSS